MTLFNVKKYHANVLGAILSGWSDYEKMLDDYADGTGSAAKEAEKSANNWEGSLNRLSNTWTKMVGDFADSGEITDLINLFNNLLSTIKDLVEFFKPLPSLISLISGAMTFKNIGKLSNLFRNGNEYALHA